MSNTGVFRNKINSQKDLSYKKNLTKQFFKN